MESFLPQRIWRSTSEGRISKEELTRRALTLCVDVLRYYRFLPSFSPLALKKNWTVKAALGVLFSLRWTLVEPPEILTEDSARKSTDA